MPPIKMVMTGGWLTEFTALFLPTLIYSKQVPSGYLLHSHGIDGPNRNRW